MKKLFLYVFLGLLWCNFSYAGKNTISLFGIELGSHVNEYKSALCYNTEKIDHNSFTGNKLNLNKLTPADVRDWRNLIYKKSKLPVTEGCVKPKIENDDFFNFEVMIYPKSKEVYRVSATYKKVFTYSYNELLPTFYDEETKYKSVSLTGSECNQVANSLASTVMSTYLKKGFKSSGLSGADYSTIHEVQMKKGGSENNPKYKFRIISGCQEDGKGWFMMSNKKNVDYLKKRNFLVGILILNSNQTRRIQEEMALKDEKAKEDINKEGL